MVQLTVIRSAQISMPYGYAFRGTGSRWAAVRSGQPPLRAVCLAFVVRHPSAGVILIDTGFHPDARSDLRHDFGLPMRLMFRGLRPAEEPFDEQLRALEIAPESVERVLMTHLHVDHTSGMRLLPNARFTCAKREWAATQRNLAWRAGYVRGHLPPASRVALIDLTDGEPFGPFQRTIDWLGDGSVRLIDTPGHTVGHFSVLLQVEGGPQVLLVGDAAYTRRNIDEQTLPLLTADDAAARRSLRELHAFAAMHPDALLVPSHDPDAWRELPAAATAGAA